MQTTVQQIMEYAKQSLENLTGFKILSVHFRAKYKAENIEKIKSAVCVAYEISTKDLVKKCRDQKLVSARQMFYYIALEKFGMTAMGASKIFRQDHTNALHGKEKVKDLLSINDKDTQEKLEFITAYLKT